MEAFSDAGIPDSPDHRASYRGLHRPDGGDPASIRQGRGAGRYVWCRLEPDTLRRAWRRELPEPRDDHPRGPLLHHVADPRASGVENLRTTEPHPGRSAQTRTAETGRGNVRAEAGLACWSAQHRRPRARRLEPSWRRTHERVG